MKLLEERALSPNALFLLYATKHKQLLYNYTDCEYAEALNNLQDRKFIKITNLVLLNYELRPEGERLVKQLDELFKTQVITTKKLKEESVDIMDDISGWIDDYRSLFKGKKVGAMGDKTSCIAKMARFFKQYPEHADKDKVMKAAEKYINSEGLNQNYKFLQRADYFIFKESSSKDEISKLASFCDELGVDDTEISMTRAL